MDVTLTDIENLQNETTAVGALNANFDAIETAFEEALTTTGPNVLSANVDMNSHRILNLPAATTDTEPVRKAEFDASALGDVSAVVAEVEAALVEVDAALAASAVATAAATAAAGLTIGDGSITTVKLATDAVTTVKIANANVTTAKLADDAVTTAKIADGAVTTDLIATDAVTNAKLANMATLTIKGNITGGSENPSDIPIADLASTLISTGSFASTPTGAVIALAHSTVPSGWLECNGAAVSRSTYGTLFALVSTTYGVGNGTTTFNLPDLRGEFVRGWDHSRGIDSGRAIGTTQADALKTHTHTFTGLISTTSGYTIGGVDDTAREFPAGTSGTTDATGAAETRPRNVSLMYVIKT